MQVPFPELTDLWLSSYGETVPVIPDSFLDGSASRLRYFNLEGIPFPGLPKMLSSAPHLVDLRLYNIPDSGYISPEAIVALISELSSLERLVLEFQSPQSGLDRETRRPPSKRSVIPALHLFQFKGVTEYLEDLVTGIDTPQLDKMSITFFDQIDFDTPRLAQFINRTPKLGKRDATLEFHDNFASAGLSSGHLRIEISCGEPDRQLSSIEQVCNSSLHPLSTVEVLYIQHRYSELVWEDDAIDNTIWLQLLLPFTAVMNLYLPKEFAPGIAAALKELVEGRITEVLPSLQNILVKGLEPSGPFQENIGQFVAARQLSDHPIAIAVWEEDSDTESKVMQPVSYIPRTLAFAHPVSLWPRRKSPLLFNSPSLLLTSLFLLNFLCRFLYSIYHTLYRALSDTSSHMQLYEYVDTPAIRLPAGKRS
jgi:hypothetical protein